ncbi:MAG: glycosyltransferase family 9 protein [Nitrospirae bacterium]|nr:glycosyltransferase family 9 protein [Nitrospirota bacterium]
MNKIEALKKIDSLLGPPLVKALSLLLLSQQKRREKQERKPERAATSFSVIPACPESGSAPPAVVPAAAIRLVLFIRPGGIGDAVHLIPAIRAFKAMIGSAEIHLLCEKRNAGVFSLCTEISRIYLYDKGPGLLTCLANRYDAVIDTEQWHRLSAIMAVLSRAPVTVGFGTNDRKILFTHSVAYSHDDYEVLSFMHLLEPIMEPMLGPLTATAPTFDDDAPFINVGEDVGEPEAGLQNLLPLYPGDTLVSIFPGASVKERQWGGHRYGLVSAALIARGLKVAIIGAPSDTLHARAIIKQCPACLDLTGKTSLAGTAAVLKRSGLLISADSGILHLGVAVGTPTVSLFGPGIEKKWGPKGKRHRIINKCLPCSPCTEFGYTPTCKINVKCLSMITEDEVIEAAVELLADG